MEFSLRLISFLAIVVINFTTGMIAAFFIFVAQLPHLIASFQPNVISGILFFLTCVIGGISVIASFLALLYGSSAVVALTIASQGMQRIEGRSQSRQRINHRHYD